MSLVGTLITNTTYFFRKWVDYTFRTRSPTSWGVKYFSIALVTELGLVASNERLELLWNMLDELIGVGWSLAIRGLVEFVFGTWINVGYSWINVVIKFVMVMIFLGAALFKESNTNIRIILGSRPKWKPNKKWFAKNLSTHFTKDIQNKYEDELFEDQGKSLELCNHILFENNYQTEAKNLLELIKKELNKYIKLYASLLRGLEEEKIQINKTSHYHVQFEELYQKREHLLNSLDEQLKLLKRKEYLLIHIRELKPAFLKASMFVDLEDEKYYQRPDRYIDRKSINRDLINQVVGQVNELHYDYDIWERLVSRVKPKNVVVHGNAGMGKSNLSAFIVKKLSTAKAPIIFLKGSSFRGSPDDFHKIFNRLLEVPLDYQLFEILDLLNTYGSKRNQRVTIIIDALNETTFENQGFSDLWKNHLDYFLSEILNRPFLFSVITLRTSYVSRIWEDSHNYPEIRLTGFDNYNLESAIKKYFQFYKISDENLDLNGLYFLRTPLMLDLYCKMTNPDRQTKVPSTAGMSGFKDLLERYINTLKESVVNKLNLTSSNLVQNGIDGCSEAMLNELEAHIPVDLFYNLMEGEKVRNINNTIGESILSGHLVYLEESFDGESVIKHSQQQVGGYLLSKFLLQKLNGLSNVVKDDFFRNQYLNPSKEAHQLKKDILDFLILEEQGVDILSSYIGNKEIRETIVEKLQREPSAEYNSVARQKLFTYSKDRKNLLFLLDQSREFLVNPASPLRITAIDEELEKLELFEFDMIWTRFLYENSYYFEDLLEEIIHALKSNSDEFSSKVTEYVSICVWILESTVKNLRDRATIALLEIGTRFPELIFEALIKQSNVNRPYSYERLSQVSYGVTMRKQNDSDFIKNVLSRFSQMIYELQFGSKPKAASYHYIVIDSLKHLCDIAISKNALVISPTHNSDLQKYKFKIPFKWVNANEDDRSEFKHPISWHSQKPDPIGSDFTVYTIPRLIMGDGNRDEAVTSIYKRIKNLGYKTIGYDEATLTGEKEYFYGTRIASGKIERLGKKYSWISLFEYAGHLLTQDKLAVWINNSSTDFNNITPLNYYERLGDIVLDISFPKASFINKKIYSEDLLEERNKNPNWMFVEKFDSTKAVWKNEFDDVEYFLLGADLSLRLDEEYKVRSTIYIDAFFVKRKDLAKSKKAFLGRTLELNDAIHHLNSLNHVYFGELYWADTIPAYTSQIESLPTGEYHEYEREITFHDLTNPELRGKEVGSKIKDRDKIFEQLELEQTLIDYGWESDSEVVNFPSSQVPAPKIGKHLNLMSDPINMEILDKKGKKAFSVISYKSPDGNEKQKLHYLRLDLLNEYLLDNDLDMIYQVKQFSYDRLKEGSKDFRGLKYYLPFK